jgi:hypothetical protein
VFDPVVKSYGPAAAIGSTSVVAYLLGSLITGAASTRLNRIEWLAAFPVRPFIARHAFWIEKESLLGEDVALNEVSRRRRVRAIDLQRLERYYFPYSAEMTVTVEVTDPDSGMRTEEGRTGFLWDGSYAWEFDEAEDPASVDPWIPVGGRAAFFDVLDMQSAGVRLHIANGDLWDQYDRLNAEAELRLTLVYPLLLLAVGVAWRGTWWAGLLVLLLTLALFRDGDGRARAANNVIVTSLVTEVIDDPALTRYAAEVTSEREHYLARFADLGKEESGGDFAEG